MGHLRHLVLLVVVAVLATACGSSTAPTGTPAEASADGGATPAATEAGSPSAEATHFTFWTFVDRHAEWWQKRAEEWNAQNPDRQIALDPSVIEYAQMHDNLAAAFVNGSGAPELVDIELGKFGNFLKGTPHLLDLTAESQPYVPDLLASRLTPYQFGGKQYALDYHLGAYLAFYNKELLAKAGIDPATIKTWDDYVAAGKKFMDSQNPDRDPDGAWFSTIETTDLHTIVGPMLMNGGGFYDASGNLTITAPGNVTALQNAADMVLKDKIAIPSPGGFLHAPEFYAAMQAGKIASFEMPQWYMTRFPDNMDSLCGKVAIGPMPTYQGQSFTTTMGGGTGTAVTDQTPAEKQQLAKDFVAWGKLTKEGQVSGWTDLGFDPYRPDVYADPALQKPDPCFSDQVTFEVIKSELGDVAPMVMGPKFPAIRDYIAQTLVYDVLVNGVDPAEALQKMNDAIEAAP
jgi:arabinosaccharide transport system substrate-binding protein